LPLRASLATGVDFRLQSVPWRTGTLHERAGTLHERAGTLHERAGTLHERAGTLSRTRRHIVTNARSLHNAGDAAPPPATGNLRQSAPHPRRK